jgi:hypothetical protein
LALKRRLEGDEIGRQLIFDTDSDCFTEDEDNDWGYEEEDDEELQPSSSSPSSWGSPQQHGRRVVNNFSVRVLVILTELIHLLV